MAGTRQRRHCDLNRCGILDEISSELLRRITERHPSRDSCPLDIERLYLCCHRESQRMGLIKAVGDCECVEHTNITGVQRSVAQRQVGLNVVFRNGSNPHHSCLEDARVIRVEAQRARVCCQQTVESYERKRASASAAVGANELAFHESHVRVENVRSGGAVAEICARTGQIEIGLTDKSSEVVNDRRIAAISMGASGIGVGSVCTFHGSRKEKMEVTKGIREHVGNGVRHFAYAGRTDTLGTLFASVLVAAFALAFALAFAFVVVVFVVVRLCRTWKCTGGNQSGASDAGRIEEGTPRYPRRVFPESGDLLVH